MTIPKNASAQNQQDFIRIQDLFYLCLNKWHWFVLSLAVCLGAAVWYLLTTPPVYTRSASILIKDDSKGKSTSGAMEDFADFGMFATSTNVNNEMGTLQSPDLMREVVSRLNLNMDYHTDGRFHRQTVYGEQLPVKTILVDFPANQAAAFTMQLKDGNVTLFDFKKDEKSINGSFTGTLNDTISSPVGKIVIQPDSSYEKEEETLLYVSHVPIQSAVAAYSMNLSVSQNDEKSNIITLTFKDVSTQRAEDVLNTLIAVYNENWVKDKNQIAVSTSMFINDRLGVIEGELGNVDNDISSYKSEHLLPDVQVAASMYMAQANEANASIKELNNQAYMARYIRNYLTDETNRFRLLPASSGIENSNISTQISEYNNQLMERNSLVSHSSVKNPLVKEMDASLQALRSALVTSIDNQLVALNAQIKSQQNYSGQVTSQIASNPNQAKYLLSVERQQKVKESLYLYLLQKREENELSQAFTAYNTRIITMPGGSMIPTAPVKKNILLMAFALGLLVPVVVIFMMENMNTVVRGRKDLEHLTIPFVGEIPLSFRKKKKFSRQPQEKECVVAVKEKSRNVINEAFRVVRTNLEFMQDKESESYVIMLTSANPDSGKTFISFNLAASLGIKGKRVLVIDLDLRKGSLSQYAGSPKKGISDYLAGDVKDIKEIIVRPSEDARLEIIPVGTIPPNPTELLFSERLNQSIAKLRKEYDYIFIDCPPVEIVADATIISQLVDMTLFIIRAGRLDRSMLPEIERFYTDKKYKNMSLILNGTDGGSGRYGYKYGYKYGYTGYTKEE
ncbi:polysaccharide biosynthesis tyrosine autokinase [uncultured Bacteroides sp.]|mgnify:CR=1 FL=1|uniref:GumC family protein n=1 Tax=uncultured Bacteroides sp. TaxID=162156 RepID=UPI0025F0CE05|nr:polysaccharide biosynthesis tyrosine autokinase [uncultured Bacteroides sp.]